MKESWKGYKNFLQFGISNKPNLGDGVALIDTSLAKRTKLKLRPISLKRLYPLGLNPHARGRYWKPDP